MGFHFGTGAACVCACLLALTAAAMPTAADLEKARPVVARVSAGKSAEKVRALASEAETEAGRYLMLETAASLHVRAKDYDKAAEALEALQTAVPDIPAATFVDLIKSVAKPIRRSKDAPRLLDLLRAAQKRAKAETVAAAERARLDKALDDVAKQLAANPDDRTLLRNRAELLAATDAWGEALATFAKLGGPVARTASGERMRKDLPAAADFWWDFEPQGGVPPRVFRAHAAQLYRTCIDQGLVKGLLKASAEERIAQIYPDGKVPAPAGGLYLVVDLSAGPEAKTYPVSNLMDVPKGGWSDEYKTAKLVLRRIEPGTFVMGGTPKDESHRVTLTQPFYIGVFETTQRQWELVMGANPSEAKGGMRPVEKVSYDAIRGKTEGTKWPVSTDVDTGSFLGRLRARAGLGFDLPTEAQWEYACRAGTTSAFNNGGDAEDDLRKVGRFRMNQTERGWQESDTDLARHRPDRAGGFDAWHTVVGSYLPNAWGLYDMHGNVWEWCLDWQGPSKEPTYGTDPAGASSGSVHVRRGGSWDNGFHDCKSMNRLIAPPYYTSKNFGFRLSCSAGLSAK